MLLWGLSENTSPYLFTPQIKLVYEFKKVSYASLTSFSKLLTLCYYYLLVWQPLEPAIIHNSTLSVIFEILLLLYFYMLF